MLVLQVLSWLVLAMEILIAGPVLYLCLLSISAALTAKKRKTRDTASASSASSRLNFAILIPAHNEEAILGTLLESLADLENMGLFCPQEKQKTYKSVGANKPYCLVK